MVIKYKSKLPLGSDGKPVDGSTNLGGTIAHMPTRQERKEQEQKNKEFRDYSDIKPMLRRIGGTMISQEEQLPKQGDTPVLTPDEMKAEKIKVKSVNTVNNSWYSWH
jgi:hypothetical protein